MKAPTHEAGRWAIGDTVVWRDTLHYVKGITQDKLKIAASPEHPGGWVPIEECRLKNANLSGERLVLNMQLTAMFNASDTFAYACAEGVNISEADHDWIVDLAEEWGSYDAVVAAMAYIKNQEPITQHRTQIFNQVIEKLKKENRFVWGDDDYGKQYIQNGPYRKVLVDSEEFENEMDLAQYDQHKHLDSDFQDALDDLYKSKMGNSPEEPRFTESTDDSVIKDPLIALSETVKPWENIGEIEETHSSFLNQIYSIDLGQQAPVKVKVISIENDEVELLYLNSSDGRIETMSLDGFKKLI